MVEGLQPDGYRLAAEAALAELDWCIDCLRRMRRKGLAARLARRRAEIADLMSLEHHRERFSPRGRSRL
jgi:hypothetical protein